MFSKKWFSIFNLFAESSYVIGRSLKKRDKLMKEMLGSYPMMYMQSHYEMEVGYEASWLMKRAH